MCAERDGESLNRRLPVPIGIEREDGWVYVYYKKQKNHGFLAKSDGDRERVVVSGVTGEEETVVAHVDDGSLILVAETDEVWLERTCRVYWYFGEFDRAQMHEPAHLDHRKIGSQMVTRVFRSSAGARNGHIGNNHQF